MGVVTMEKNYDTNIRITKQTIRAMYIFAIYQTIGSVFIASNIFFIHMGINTPTYRPLAIDILWVSTVFLTIPIASLCRAVKRQKYLISYRGYKKMTLLLTLLTLVLFVVPLNLSRAIIFPTLYLIGCVAWIMHIRNVAQIILEKYINISRMAIKVLLVLTLVIDIMQFFTVDELPDIPVVMYLFTIALSLIIYSIAYFLPINMLKCVEQNEHFEV